MGKGEDEAGSSALAQTESEEVTPRDQICNKYDFRLLVYDPRGWALPTRQKTTDLRQLISRICEISKNENSNLRYGLIFQNK